ncbi:unnamed protein product [Closterium sp. NIES-53]
MSHDDHDIGENVSPPPGTLNRFEAAVPTCTGERYTAYTLSALQQRTSTARSAHPPLPAMPQLGDASDLASSNQLASFWQYHSPRAALPLSAYRHRQLAPAENQEAHVPAGLPSSSSSFRRLSECVSLQPPVHPSAKRQRVNSTSAIIAPLNPYETRQNSIIAQADLFDARQRSITDREHFAAVSRPSFPNGRVPAATGDCNEGEFPKTDDAATPRAPAEMASRCDNTRTAWAEMGAQCDDPRIAWAEMGAQYDNTRTSWAETGAQCDYPRTAAAHGAQAIADTSTSAAATEWRCMRALGSSARLGFDLNLPAPEAEQEAQEALFAQATGETQRTEWAQGAHGAEAEQDAEDTAEVPESGVREDVLGSAWAGSGVAAVDGTGNGDAAGNTNASNPEASNSNAAGNGRAAGNIGAGNSNAGIRDGAADDNPADGIPESDTSTVSNGTGSYDDSSDSDGSSYGTGESNDGDNNDNDDVCESESSCALSWQQVTSESDGEGEREGVNGMGGEKDWQEDVVWMVKEGEGVDERGEEGWLEMRAVEDGGGKMVGWRGETVAAAAEGAAAGTEAEVAAAFEATAAAAAAAAGPVLAIGAEERAGAAVVGGIEGGQEEYTYGRGGFGCIQWL